MTGRDTPLLPSGLSCPHRPTPDAAALFSIQRTLLPRVELQQLPRSRNYCFIFPYKSCLNIVSVFCAFLSLAEDLWVSCLSATA